MIEEVSQTISSSKDKSETFTEKLKVFIWHSIHPIYLSAWLSSIDPFISLYIYIYSSTIYLTKVIGKEECLQNQDESNDEYEDVITTGAVPKTISSSSKDKSETFTEKLKVFT